MVSGEVGDGVGVDLLGVGDMLRNAMSSIMRCRSGEIGLVIGVLLSKKRSPHATLRPVRKPLRLRGQTDRIG